MDFFILWLIISAVFMAGRLLADLGRDEGEEKGRIRTDLNLIALVMNMFEDAGIEMHEKLQQTPTQRAIAARRKEIEQLKQETQDFKELERLDREYDALVEHVESGGFPGTTSEKPKQREQPLRRGVDPLPHFRRELSLGRDPQIRTGSLRPSQEEKERALQAKIDAVNARVRAEINARVYGAPARSANYCPECKWFSHGHVCSCSLTRNEMRRMFADSDDPWDFCRDCRRYYSGAACACGMSRDDRRPAASEGPGLVYADGGLVLVRAGQAEDDDDAGLRNYLEQIYDIHNKSKTDDEATAEEAAFHRYVKNMREERV